MVKYGKYQIWSSKKTDDKTKCDNKSFGDDPIPGIHKGCWCDKYDFYSGGDIKEDKARWEAKEKKEEEEKTARMQAEKVK
jgi:hypothetical protein